MQTIIRFLSLAYLHILSPFIFHFAVIMIHYAGSSQFSSNSVESIFERRIGKTSSPTLGWGLCGAVTCGFHMLVQVALQRECLVTLLTNVRLDGRMRLDMRAKVGFVGEGLSALRARERTLARVRADVTLEKPRSAEALSADMTLASELMGSAGGRW